MCICIYACVSAFQTYKKLKDVWAMFVYMHTFMYVYIDTHVLFMHSSIDILFI